MDMDLLSYLNINYKCLTEQEIKFVFREVVKAIQHCHENNIMYRDLQPKNILINIDDDKLISEVRLNDFGMAAKIDDPKENNRNVGDKGFRAPEILRRDNNYDEKVDSWGLGMLLYLLITGK